MSDLLEIGPGGVGTLNLHPGQLQAWNSTRRFVYVIAGTQSGKTSFGPWWLHRETARCGPGDYLAVTATYDLFKLKMLPEMLRVFCGHLAAERWEWQASDKILTRPGYRIILRSADAEGGLESASANAAWLDECGQDRFRVEAIEAVERRLSLSQGRILGTTTPYNLGWLKTRVFDRWRAGNPDIEVVQFKSTMNPHFPREEYDRAKASLPAWKHAMFYDGDFTRPAGQIYGDFSDTENVCDAVDLRPEWPRYVGVDFGGVHTAVVWLALDPETNVLYLYDESLSGDRTTAEHCAAFKAQAAGANVVSIRGGAKSEEQWRRDWRKEGVEIAEPSIADVEAGIDRVIALIKPRRFRVFRRCTGVLDEFVRYSRKLGPDGQPTEEIADKASFHRLDAVRYAVSGLQVGGWEEYAARVAGRAAA